MLADTLAGAKKKAHVAVRLAVERGDLIRPTDCERCERTVKLHGHHADYSKPLEVEWLAGTVTRRSMHPSLRGPSPLVNCESKGRPMPRRLASERFRRRARGRASRTMVEGGPADQ